MALKLNIQKFSCYSNDKATASTSSTVSLLTDKTTAELYLKAKGSDTVIHLYVLSLVNLSFQKKMYQPTEVVAEILFTPKEENDDWFPIAKDDIMTMFENKQVSLYDMAGVTTTGGVDTVPDANYVGEDFYIHQVTPCYHSKSLCVKLIICSLDKQLTIENNSRTFVAKKLGEEILTTELSKQKKPFDNSCTIGCETANMKVLKYVHDSGKNTLGAYKTEHIFPYLVQYNESFYDMLARTCNRWGEFLFYEDGKLRIGYTQPTTITPVGNYNNLTYIDINTLPRTKSSNSASYDKNLIGTYLEEDPKEVSGEMFFLRNGGADKYFMKKLAQVLKNDKSLPTFLANTLIDDSMLTFKAMNKTRIQNNEFNEAYFEKERKTNTVYSNEHYNTNKDGKEEYSQFTEHHSTFDDVKYGNILLKEQAASKNAVCMDFDTTYPGLKLGQLIKVNDGFYIVVEINCKKNITTTYVLDNGEIKEVQKSALVFEVIATSQNTVKDDEKENTPSDLNFYPTVLPSGHIRYADPQVAIVTDTKDPVDHNRVRVKFTWEADLTKDKDNNFVITDDTKASSSPWIIYATNSAGLDVIGKHYEKSPVLVGFADGNVERPYVMGGLSLDASTDTSADDIIYKTPGGQVLKINDGDGKGLAAFLAGCLSPLANTVMGFLPGSSFKDFPATCLEGGFTLTDKYGIYKVSGSTDKREVNISSAWGNVKIDAFTGISISAPNGDISIKGKNVKIEAGNNLELLSGTNVKYKFFGDNTPIVSDFLSAAAKKLIETFTPIDLSSVRSVWEIFFRPAEGKLRIKSNRYLMLESGKGACDYPEDAYKNRATIDKIIQKDRDSNVTPGLALLPAAKQLFDKINTIGNKINNDYITKYNECVDKYKDYTDEIDASRKWSENRAGKICRLIGDKEFSDKLWDKSKSKLTENDLHFETCFKSEGRGDVHAPAILEYKRLNPGTTKDNTEIKDEIITKRIECKANILRAANELRTKVLEFYAAPELSKKVIEAELNIPAIVIPDNFKDCMVKAFSKKELGNDIFYFMDIADLKKTLAAKYGNADLDGSRKVLKRKAALIFLKEMGFKEEWRQKINDPTYEAPNVNGVAVSPAPPVPQVSIPRKTGAADLADNTYWESYVNSIVAVPKLSKDEWALTKTLKGEWSNFLDKLYFFKSYNENKSWSDAKNGSILFSSDESVYSLNGNINPVNAIIKKNLKSENANDNVDNFLNDKAAGGGGGIMKGVKTILKELN